MDPRSPAKSYLKVEEEREEEAGDHSGQGQRRCDEIEGSHRVGEEERVAPSRRRRHGSCNSLFSSPGSRTRGNLPCSVCFLCCSILNFQKNNEKIVKLVF